MLSPAFNNLLEPWVGIWTTQGNEAPSSHWRTPTSQSAPTRESPVQLPLNLQRPGITAEKAQPVAHNPNKSASHGATSSCPIGAPSTQKVIHHSPSHSAIPVLQTSEPFPLLYPWSRWLCWKRWERSPNRKRLRHRAEAWQGLSQNLGT